MNTYTQNIVKLIKERVRKVNPAAGVILYGSRAKGNPGKESDWDILILTDYPASLEIERKFRDEIFNLELEVSEALSLQAYSKNDWN